MRLLIFASVLVVDAEALLHVGAEILHHHVGLLHHAFEGGDPFGRFQVQRHAALVAMQVLEVRTLAGPTHLFFEAGRRLDLDDIGAPVGKLAHAGRPRPHAGQVEHCEARKSLRGPGRRHCGRFLVRFLPAGLHRRGQTFPDIMAIVYRCRGGRSGRDDPLECDGIGHHSGTFRRRLEFQHQNSTPS